MAPPRPTSYGESRQTRILSIDARDPADTLVARRMTISTGISRFILLVSACWMLIGWCLQRVTSLRHTVVAKVLLLWNALRGLTRYNFTTLARKASVWCPSVRLSVCPVQHVLTVTHRGAPPTQPANVSALRPECRRICLFSLILSSTLCTVIIRI